MSKSFRQVLTADGNTDLKHFTGPVHLSLTGDFGNGSAQLQAKDPSGGLVNIASGVFVGPTNTVFDFPAESTTELQVNLADSTAANLIVWLQGKLLGS